MENTPEDPSDTRNRSRSSFSGSRHFHFPPAHTTPLPHIYEDRKAGGGNLRGIGVCLCVCICGGVGEGGVWIYEDALIVFTVV